MAIRYRDFGDAFIKGLVVEGMPEDASDEQIAVWVDRNIPSVARVAKFSDFLHSESDRGAVICSCAIIDDVLCGTIRKRLKQLSDASNETLQRVFKEPPQLISDGVLDALLTRRPQPPLGSFAVRIKMARALGLIDDAIMQALEMMREMRNEAAHLAEPFSFDNPKFNVIKLFAPLTKKERGYVEFVLEWAERRQPGGPTVRRVFEISLMSIFDRLSSIFDRPEWASWIFGGKGVFDGRADEVVRARAKLEQAQMALGSAAGYPSGGAADPRAGTEGDTLH